MKLLAIDFETANRSPESACAIGVASIERGRITKSFHRLIRPPRRLFTFSPLHGISWADVKAEPSFVKVWSALKPFWDTTDYFLAHNPPFDRNVLVACCLAAGRTPPAVPFICTVRVARSHWHIRPTSLPIVCAHLGIPLNHHHALSDAIACASIALRAISEGFPIRSAEVRCSR
jgi:DNA polymerase III subunit epsilon